MRDNGAVETFLKSYEIPEPDERQVSECIKHAKNIMKVNKVPRDDSLRFFLETQMKYMRGEVVFSVCFSIGMLLLLAMTMFWELSNDLLKTSVEMAPFLVTPIFISIKKSRFYGMMELEMACKHSLQKILAARILLNEILGVLVLSLFWLAGGVSMENFEMNRLFFSLISFSVTCICFLWFGKKSIRTGVFAGAAWTLLTMILLSWDAVIPWMIAINSVALFLITLVMGIVVVMVTGRYIKQISFESEELKWNFGWID